MVYKRKRIRWDAPMPDGTLAHVGPRWQLEGIRPPRKRFETGAKWDIKRRNQAACLAWVRKSRQGSA